MNIFTKPINLCFWYWKTFSSSKWVYLFLLLFALPLTIFSQAQKAPAEPVICPAKFEDMFTRVNIPDSKNLLNQRILKQNATAEFQITFGPGAEANPEAKAAFQYALDIWATQIVSSVPIKIYVDFADLGPGVLASAGPAYNVFNFPGAPEEDVLYPAALANSLAGEVLFPDEEYDLIVNLGNGIPWYFGLDGNTPAGLFDFVTVALHEAGHGLGFTTVRGYNAGVGTLRSGGRPSVFGIFIVDGDGNLLINFPDPSEELGDAFTGGDIFMDGTFARAALGGERPELYAPSNFQGGSSIAHWDEAAFPAGNPNSLMTPQVGSAESNFDIGDITRGLFKDMGWVINDDNAPPVVVSPATFDEELFTNNIITKQLELSNISDSLITVDITPFPGSVLISNLSQQSITIASGETDSITFDINATGIAKGTYSDTLLIEVADFNSTISVPVNVRVIDGSEAPEISVNPNSFSVELEQFQQATRDLTISNSGDDDLIYKIEIENDSLTSFNQLVEQTDATIRTNGLQKFKVNRPDTDNLSSAIIGEHTTQSKVVTSLYATGFESFSTGDINGQNGWLSQYAGNWTISNENPKDSSLHFRGVSDGLGGTRTGNILAISPTITPLAEPFMTASADINIQGSGVTWEFIPQSPTEGSVVTRIRFNPDGTIDALTESNFTRLDAMVPEGYFNLKLVVDKDDSSFSVFIDGELIFSGQGFASIIEQVIFLSAMETTGSTFDVDNLEVTDGDPDAFFLSVVPSSGVVPFGESETLTVKFDARVLSSGTYNATINVWSNDSTNSPISVPVELTVVAPPQISVFPDNLSAAVDVTTDDPPTAVESFTITNSGESSLQFNINTGNTSFNPPSSNARKAAIDLANYGLGNIKEYSENSVFTKGTMRTIKSSSGQPLNSSFTDSIYYDSGIGFPDNFSGLQTSPYTTAMKFDVESNFTLTAIRNGFRTESVSDPVIILEIYAGGNDPTEGELLLSQTVEQGSEEGIVIVETLEESIDFEAGDTFWVVHKYPEGIEFPQGVDDNATQRPDTYFFSGDGGETYNPSGFVFFVRALSGSTSEGYIAVEPSTGNIAPGDSLIVTATFDGSSLANGTYNTPLNVTSNDPINSSVVVNTQFSVSGQVSNIEFSEEYILFNDVFKGAERTRTFTISNTGLALINISGISSDNPDFTVDISEAQLPAGESIEVSVTFAPSSLGSINGLITIESDAANNTSFDLVVNGVGVDPPIALFDPETITETTDAGTTVETSVSLKNEGNSPLIFSFPDLAIKAALNDPTLDLSNAELLAFENFNPQTAEKTTLDTRVGSPVEKSIGVDNGFGYSWIDSDEDGGPIYNFTDITTSGTEVTAALGGDGSTEVALSFPFEYYGEEQNSVFINANGFLAFSEPASPTWLNTQIPVDDNVNNVIAGFWSDLEPQEFDGAVHFQDFGDHFIVQWTQATEFLGEAEEYVTFQIVLYNDGNIDVFYDDVSSASFLNTATVGIENADGSDGAQVAFNTNYVKDGLALRFVKPDLILTPFISNVSPLSGVVPAGGSRQIDVTLDATELNDGVYYDELFLSSNAPSEENNTALFELTVIGFPEISLQPDSLNFDSLFVGLSSDASFLITNTGSKTLDISSISNANNDFISDESGPISLAPDESRIVNVTFIPSSFELIEDEIIIQSNDAFGNPTSTVYVSGIGVDPPVIGLDPDSIAVSVYKTDSVTSTVSVSNNGNYPLTYFLSTPAFGKAGNNLTTEGYEKLEYEKILSKESEDNRVGPAFLNASGGPGTFGYTWVDNNSGGPSYEYIDISSMGTLADVGGDGDITVPLPFNFNFFGNDQSEVTIGANGFLTFAPIVGNNFTNQQIPDESNPNYFIAPLWDDLEPQNGTGVFYYGTSEYFIVQYEEVPGFGFPPFLPEPAPVSFQVILFPDGSFKFQYKNVESTISTSSTVGIEGPMGMSGLQVIFNTEYLTNELAISFTPPVGGTVQPGEADDVAVTFYSDELEADSTYFGDIVVRSNDPITPQASIPVALTVLPIPEVIAFTLINADIQEEIGPLSDGDVINLDNYRKNKFSIVAEVDGKNIGSVVFDFNEEQGFQTENFAPYSLNGDFSGGNKFYPVELPLGINTVTATPFTKRNGNGFQGIPLSINFEVINNNSSECYGESVLSYNPGNRKNGRALPESRSNPEQALGEPQENDNFNFVSLGFGGSIEIALGCEVLDREGDDLLIVETSFRDGSSSCLSYPEKAKIEASENGIDWFVVSEEICRDGSIDLADGGLEKASYLRITDISDPADFRGGNADGYDLDGIIVINKLSAEAQKELMVSVNETENLVTNEQDVDIKVYPVPADNFIKVNFKGMGERYYTEIYNLNGESVLNSNLGNVSGVRENQFNVETLRPGIYIMRLISESGMIITQKKIIKQ
ncbi:choice-of-anchor D domain-containing protein [Mangrovivirga sp. M17]|uniref:Choice-of-anchor D domain-containing protein n=1 Tax=Mangrovivirga halotolerans TaxID=2993936 RepID=A0ABT3RN23_9BACT|nr:choice-of-anchor D domain-containing protein [Mangrovivirga halotolerans]MCX2742738.1 choice-of-anchor D domain-containing protein [Mangrovivirga halotolerans]